MAVIYVNFGSARPSHRRQFFKTVQQVAADIWPYMTISGLGWFFFVHISMPSTTAAVNWELGLSPIVLVGLTILLAATSSNRHIVRILGMVLGAAIAFFAAMLLNS
jgi:hypothetical protein